MSTGNVYKHIDIYMHVYLYYIYIYMYTHPSSTCIFILLHRNGLMVVHCRTYVGETALHIAAQYNDGAMIQVAANIHSFQQKLIPSTREDG